MANFKAFSNGIKLTASGINRQQHTSIWKTHLADLNRSCFIGLSNSILTLYLRCINVELKASYHVPRTTYHAPRTTYYIIKIVFLEGYPPQKKDLRKHKNLNNFLFSKRNHVVKILFFLYKIFCKKVLDFAAGLSDFFELN